MAELDHDLLMHVKALLKGREHRPSKVPFFLGALGGLDADDPGEPTNVFIVDGDKMRLEHDMDFVAGNNSEEQPSWVKDLNGGDCGALYLDDRTTPDQWVPNLYHEAREYHLMCDGKEYEQAHEQANAEEKLVRQHIGRESGKVYTVEQS
jgi:hypothetical protein